MAECVRLSLTDTEQGRSSRGGPTKVDGVWDCARSQLCAIQRAPSFSANPPSPPACPGTSDWGLSMEGHGDKVECCSGAEISNWCNYCHVNEIVFKYPLLTEVGRWEHLLPIAPLARCHLILYRCYILTTFYVPRKLRWPIIFFYTDITRAVLKNKILSFWCALFVFTSFLLVLKQMKHVIWLVHFNDDTITSAFKQASVCNTC